MIRNERFLAQAEKLKPILNVTKKEVHGENRTLKRGEEMLLDFGNHYVGYVTMELDAVGRHLDAPVLFEVRFYEHEEEFDEKPESYCGWICDSWIQSEQIHIDVMPYAYRLERRYAFRYVKLKMLSMPAGISVIIKKMTVDAVSSADDAKLLPFSGKPEDKQLDDVSVRTLHECMQEVFEDGPKRDRRLWLGDLRLQALADYVTYKDYDLVKRCLYLFAGDTLEGGLLSNNLFLYPYPECDAQWMFDYSMFFINVLWDYYSETKDKKTLMELEPTAYRQYELLSRAFDEKHLIDMNRAGNCFVDWNQELDKQASAQAVYIYSLKALTSIEKALGKETAILEKEITDKSTAAKNYLFSEKKGLFISGPYEQISYASQVWMVLAGVIEGDGAKKVLERVEQCESAVGMSTPYMYHHYIQALIDADEKQRAYVKMKWYWGKMLDKNADTFFEVFDPKNPDASPYGGKIVHSYCHAWSCTPTYFLRKYFAD